MAGEQEGLEGQVSHKQCACGTSSTVGMCRMENQNQAGITALEWDPKGYGSPEGNQIVFADKDGYVGVFQDVYPSEDVTNQNTDPLAEDSLLMEVRMHVVCVYVCTCVRVCMCMDVHAYVCT